MRIASLLILLAVALTTVHAAEIDMTTTDDVNRDDFVMGVQIDNLYYTAVIQDGILNKLEFNGAEMPNFTIETTFAEVTDFINNYGTMTWLDKMKFLVVDLKLPLKYVMKLDLNNG